MTSLAERRKIVDLKCLYKILNGCLKFPEFKISQLLKS